MRYIQDLPRIGKGSSRYVYNLGDGNIMKLAYWSAGYAQNRKEYELSHTHELLAPVKSISDDGFCIIMKAAFSGVVEDDLLPYLLDIHRLAKKTDLMLNDLLSTTSWGFIDKQLTIIDYGCTSEIFNKYYKNLESFIPTDLLPNEITTIGRMCI